MAGATQMMQRRSALHKWLVDCTLTWSWSTAARGIKILVHAGAGTESGDAGGKVITGTAGASHPAAGAGATADAVAADAAVQSSQQPTAAIALQLPNGTPLGRRQQQSESLQPLPQPQRPQVSVSYARLPPKSKERLEEALIGWAAWHAAAYGDETQEDDGGGGGLITNITPVRLP